MADKNEHFENEKNNEIKKDKDKITHEIHDEEKQEIKEPVVEIENNEFIDKVEGQVTKILKDLNSLSFHGSKSELSEQVADDIIAELREQTNISKKQFSLNINKKDQKSFGSVSTHVAKVSKEIRVLTELSNKYAGEFSEDHIKVIFDAIKKKTNEVKKELKTTDHKDDKFSF